MTEVSRDAGAGSELDVNLARTVVLEAELEAGRARLTASDAKRTLARVLGLAVDAESIALIDPLPQAPLEVPPADRVLDAALAARLDIRVARQLVAVAREDLELEQRSVLSSLSVGVAMERESRPRSSDGDFLSRTLGPRNSSGTVGEPDDESEVVVGPSFEFELPLFDQNQAGIARATYALEQANRTVEALEHTATQEVRGAVDRTLTAWRLAGLYRDGIVPLATTNMSMAREAYQAGKVWWLSVLEAQRTLNGSQSRYVEANRDAATAAVRLEQAAGVPMARIGAGTGAGGDGTEPAHGPADRNEP